MIKSLVVFCFALYSGALTAGPVFAPIQFPKIDAPTFRAPKIEFLRHETFAHVSSEGVVNPARSRRIRQGNVKVIAKGQYCFNHIRPRILGGQVTIDPTVSKFTHFVSLSLDHPGCQALVVIGCTEKPTASAFFVKFY